MGRGAKAYIFAVIAAGFLVLTCALATWSPVVPRPWMIYAALTVLASVVKLRLPGMDGTYSLSFLFLLYGMAHFSLPEVLIAGCAGAVAQSLLNAKTRHGLIQVFFNAANVAVSVGACFLIRRVWLAASPVHYLPAVMALVACAYFVINTVLVSGILSLLHKKPLAEVCGQWYTWSFPYYLVGVTLVGLLPAPGQTVSGETWLILLPVLYLVHFFLGLAEWHTSSPGIGKQSNAPMPRAARTYLIGVVTAGMIVLAAAVFGWQSQNPTRFVTYLALAVLASTFKIRLPYVQGTLTPAFVLLLAAIAQLSLGETAVMAAVVGAVQVLWRPARRPMLAQVLFNPACLALSAAFAWVLSRIALVPWLDHSAVGLLLVSTLVLYGSNTVIVATMLAFLNQKSLSSVWQICYFWSLPYYLVGAAAAGVMTAMSRTADWTPSLLVLPLMGLLFLSYRIQIGQAVARNEPTPA
jgi:hypothetical protein